MRSVNAWRLKEKVTNMKIPYIEFLREVTTDLLTIQGTKLTRTRAIALPSSVTNRVRFDGNNHWPVSTDVDPQTEKPRRRNCKWCAMNKKRDNETVLMCEKCVVPLHIHCFKEGIYFSIPCV